MSVVVPAGGWVSAGAAVQSDLSAANPMWTWPWTSVAPPCSTAVGTKPQPLARYAYQPLVSPWSTTWDPALRLPMAWQNQRASPIAAGDCVRSAACQGARSAPWVQGSSSGWWGLVVRWG